HATNHFVIFDDIGWFPLVGIMTALIFFDADWPERLGRWIRRPRFAPPDWGWFAGGAIMLPVLGGALGWRLPSTAPAGPHPPPTKKGRPIVPWIVAWLAVQALLPIRHYFISGDGRFTYEGMSF